MKKSAFISLSMLFLTAALSGCGGYSQTADVKYHYNTSLAELQHRGGYPVNVQVMGYAQRVWKGTQWDCDIWLPPLEAVPSLAVWLEIIEHEKRHCYEGDFHKESPASPQEQTPQGGLTPE